MKYFKEDNALVIKSWCNDPEDGAIEQAKNAASLPFAFKQICLLPDAHKGFFIPIGCVLATKDYIIPSSVGLDIFCGVNAIKTSITSDISTETIKKVMSQVREVIPFGFNHHNTKQDSSLLPEVNSVSTPIVSREYEKALYSLGSCGSGNHFWNLLKDQDNFVWVMLHSGSRNLGKQVAEHYNKVAVKLNAKWFSSVPKEWGLAFLPFNSEEGQQYWREMQYCGKYALASRKLMMDRTCAILSSETGCSFEPMIDISHNYAEVEEHFGETVIVHRKGATLASTGTIGLIPGSQGTQSYVVRGKGNPESFNSCSHGAGRKMARGVAKRTLNFEEEKGKMEEKGIIHSIRSKENLDEAPGSYKDIEAVMAEQADLVDILFKLDPLAIIKG